MLSNEPPDEGCGGGVGCCGAVTTGLMVTGAAGWEKRNKNDGWHICLWDSNSPRVSHQAAVGLKLMCPNM